MDIKAIRGMLGSNTFIVKHEQSILIIDAGASINDVKKALGDTKPDAILLTHEHFDHTLNIADYVEAFNCEVYAHAATVEELHSNMLGREIGWGKIKIPSSFTKFRSITHDELFEIADTKIEAILAPGHSEGSILFKINNKLFTGDVLFKGTIGRTDFIPNGDELMQQSLKKLQNIPFETAYHGHGRSTSFEEQKENIKQHIE